MKIWCLHKSADGVDKRCAQRQQACISSPEKSTLLLCRLVRQTLLTIREWKPARISWGRCAVFCENCKVVPVCWQKLTPTYGRQVKNTECEVTVVWLLPRDRERPHSCACQRHRSCHVHCRDHMADWVTGTGRKVELRLNRSEHDTKGIT